MAGVLIDTYGHDNEGNAPAARLFSNNYEPLQHP